jgi:hypothetical protein
MNYEEVMPVKVRHDEFKLESIGTVTVSTIALPPWMVDKRVKFETAVIWEATHPMDEGFLIVHVGFDQAEAEDVHQYWCDAQLLARAVCLTASAGNN